MAIVKGRKVKPRVRAKLKAISQQEWLVLKQHLSARTDIRGMMLHLIQCTGARLEEVCRIDIDDVKKALKTGELYIHPAKGSLERYCRTVPDKLLLLLVALEAAIPRNQPIACLISRTNNPRAWMRSLQRELLDICRELKLQPYSPHAFRHSYCMMLIQGTNNIATVQKIIGHKSIANTARYLVSAETSEIEQKLALKFA